jgi:hypothetical protein
MRTCPRALAYRGGEGAAGAAVPARLALAARQLAPGGRLARRLRLSRSNSSALGELASRGVGRLACVQRAENAPGRPPLGVQLPAARRGAVCRTDSAQPVLLPSVEVSLKAIAQRGVVTAATRRLGSSFEEAKARRCWGTWEGGRSLSRRSTRPTAAPRGQAARAAITAFRATAAQKEWAARSAAQPPEPTCLPPPPSSQSKKCPAPGLPVSSPITVLPRPVRT